MDDGGPFDQVSVWMMVVPLIRFLLDDGGPFD